MPLRGYSTSLNVSVNVSDEPSLNSMMKFLSLSLCIPTTEASILFFCKYMIIMPGIMR